jgi:hypothetical protein
MTEPPRDPAPELERELPRPPDLDFQRGPLNDERPPPEPPWWATRPAKWFYVAVGVATIVSGVTGLFGSPFTEDTPTGAVQPTQASVTSSVPLSTRGSPVSAAVQTGDCLDPSNRSVPCDAAHRYEVVAVPTAACSSGDAIQYLGGHVARDVLLVPPAVISLPDRRRACVIEDPGKGFYSGTAKGVLRTAASARWRRCADELVDDTTVPCSAPHTAEFVGIDGLTADGAACKRAAEAYMGVGIDEVSDRLAVAVVPTRNVADGNPRCLVRVLGNAILTSTLRDVRAGTLPISARE